MATKILVHLYSLVLSSAIAASASAQTTAKVQFGAPPGEQFRYAIEHLPDLSPEERQALVAKIPKVFPVFIFIPGVMGSKLTKIENGKEKVIFGEFDARNMFDSDIIFDKPSERITAELLEEYTVNFYVTKKREPIYKKAKQEIEEMSAKYGVDVMFFGYDWRGSNVDAANILSKWLCKWKSKLEGRPVVFLAHSMGGLVLKYWLWGGYDKVRCDGDADIISNWLKIDRVAFLGTPHYGAPQALFAFAESYYLLYDPLAARNDTGLYSKIVNFTKEEFDRHVLSRALNAYGATFASGYQLLPITTSTCFSSPIPSPILISSIGQERNLDIFDQASWITYGWPRNLHSSIRDAFLSKQLPARLANAKIIPV
jgi:Lecithin:cholesterol acyltransferase